MSNSLDKQYTDLLKTILEHGVDKKDRTGTGTKSIFGYTIRHNMKDGFPLLTTKKMPFKTIVTELLWFLRGDTNIKYLVDNNCHIWDGDCYKRYFFNWRPMKEDCGEDLTPYTQEEFINRIKTDDEFAKKWGELGPIYGKQWRSWGSSIIDDLDDVYTREVDYDIQNKKLPQYSSNRKFVIDEIKKHNPRIDQIANLINDLKTNPDSRRLMVNAWNVGELDSMVLPPCFTEDMMVACVDGYRKISEITENDLVLTEDGSYQKVYELHETKYNDDLIKFKVFGNTKYVTCTPNHPFLIKDKGYVNVNELTENDYLALPINKNSIIPSFDTWLKDNQYSEKLVTTKLDNFDYWFLMGYFLGDGWLIHSKEEIYFTIKNEQTDLILPRLKNIIGLAKLNNSGVNCTKYVGKKKQVFEILSKFGKYADGKFIPKFIHDAPKEYIEHFIEGYLMADGCKTKNGVSYTTVSENIAYGLQLLYAKLGVKASVYFQKRPKKKFIEGREVNQKNTFSINVYKQKNKTKSYFLDTDYLWVKVKEINKINFNGYVYNISVENNHTYNVYNLINHNCHYGFQVYTRELSSQERVKLYEQKTNADTSFFPVLSETLDFHNIPTRAISLMWNQRSVDTFLGLPFNIASYGLLLEIIAKEVNMVPDELIGNLGDVHLYSNHIEQAKEQIGRDLTDEERYNIWFNNNYETGMERYFNSDNLPDFDNEYYEPTPKRTREPFPLPTLKLGHFGSILENISVVDLSDFIIENYQSHPTIKAPLSN